jgi:hypothetical protein
MLMMLMMLVVGWCWNETLVRFILKGSLLNLTITQLNVADDTEGRRGVHAFDEICVQ